MELRSLLVFLFVSTVFASEWHPVKVMAVNPDGTLLGKVQNALQDALKWFELAVSVQKVDKEPISNVISKYDELQRLNDFVELTVTTPAKLFSLEFKDTQFESLREESDFVVFILPGEDHEDYSCQGNLKAFASPDIRKEKRPTDIFLYYCYNSHDDQVNFFDLFRHEILHGFGYGTIRGETLNPETYEWRMEDDTFQDATRNFITSRDAAIDSVKKHFGCYNSTVHGVESDEERKHLNEYIFMNELMTPILSKRENYFSYISAAVLENTFDGNMPWYRVNRTFIAPEAESYTHGRGFGCKYLLKSCYDYIDDLRSNGQKRPLVMCPDDNAPEECFDLPNEPAPFVAFECLSQQQGGKADNGIEMQNPSKPVNYMNSNVRYCPIFQYLYELPEGTNETSLKPCVH